MPSNNEIVSSASQTTSSDVPQGSLLSPLFLLHFHGFGVYLTFSEFTHILPRPVYSGLELMSSDISAQVFYRHLVKVNSSPHPLHLPLLQGGTCLSIWESFVDQLLYTTSIPPNINS